MKKIFLLSLFSGVICFVKAQTNPAQFKVETKKITPTNYEIIIRTTIQKPWHIYAQNTPAGGPVPTTIRLNKNPLIIVPKENFKEQGKLEKSYDKNFKINVLYYSNEVVFTKPIQLKKPIKTNVSGSIEYMLCNDNQCLPPKTQNFSLGL